MNFPTQMELKPGMYVAVVYDNEWYVGCIADRSEQFEDVLVNCMHQCSTKNNISWPTRQDKCNIPFNHVLCSVSASIPQGGHTVSKMRQFRRFNNASNNSKTKMIESCILSTLCHFNL